MFEKYDVAITGLCFSNDYGNVLSYYLLNRIIESFGKSVLMLGNYNKDNVFSSFFEEAYADNYIQIRGNEEKINTLCNRFVVGGGQIWNYGIASNFNDEFYLGFVNKKNVRISYGTSIGHSRDFSPLNKRNEISDYLNKFNFISVRDSNTQSYIKNTYKISSELVLDPLMLCPKVYEELISNSSLRKNDTPKYILLMMLDYSDEKVEYAEYIAKEKNCEVIMMDNTMITNPDTFNRLFSGCDDVNISVNNYLKLISDSECVISDSYSCSCISLTLKKTTISLLNHKRGASRFISLYKMLKIEEYLLEEWCKTKRDIPLFDEEKVIIQEELLDKMRSNSLNWLSNAISTQNISSTMFENNNVSVYQRQNDLYERIIKHPIVIIGAGINAKRFCDKYADVLNIRLVMTNSKSEKEFVLSNGKRYAVSEYKKEKIERKDLVIVCRQDISVYYKDVCDLLIRDGFKFGEEYISSQLATTLLERKKIITFVGYCQMDVIRDIFTKVNVITEDYDCIFFRLSRDTLKDSYKFCDFVKYTELSNIFVYIPLFTAVGKTDVDYLKLLSFDTKTYSFPRLAFRGLHPYKADDLETFHELTRYNGHVHWPFLYQERYLDELILNGKSNEEIYAEVMSPLFISEKDIQRNLKKAYKAIEISEKNTDLKMLDYIKDNLKEKHLYKDCLHYQNCMYFEIARRMSKFLNLYAECEIDFVEEKCNIEEKTFIDFTEIPVLPCVSSVLGISYATEGKLYRVRQYDGTIKKMTIKEWVYSYCDYTRSIVKIKEFFFMQ